MKVSTEPVAGRRMLTAGELAEWSRGDGQGRWAPTFELNESAIRVDLFVDLPGCGAGDIQIALLPRSIILKRKVRFLACRSLNDVWQALFGPSELFRRFEMPASIDVNRVKAELEMGVLSVVAPKRAASDDQTQAFAA